jgi:hypothetical protein
MNLVAGEFSFWALTGDYDSAAGAIDFDGVLQCHFEREKEEFLEHFDDVIVGVFVIVKEDDMVKPAMLFLLGFLNFGPEVRESKGALHRLTLILQN